MQILSRRVSYIVPPPPPPPPPTHTHTHTHTLAQYSTVTSTMPWLTMTLLEMRSFNNVKVCIHCSYCCLTPCKGFVTRQGTKYFSEQDACGTCTALVLSPLYTLFRSTLLLHRPFTLNCHANMSGCLDTNLPVCPRPPEQSNHSSVHKARWLLSLLTYLQPELCANSKFIVPHWAFIVPKWHIHVGDLVICNLTPYIPK